MPMLGFIVPSGSEFLDFGAEAAILDFERLARALSFALARFRFSLP